MEAFKALPCLARISTLMASGVEIQAVQSCTYMYSMVETRDPDSGLRNRVSDAGRRPLNPRV